MWNWLREYLEIRAQFRERKVDAQVCASCETLKMQLALANQNNQKLLDRLLREPEPIKEPEPTSDIQFSLPQRHVSWRLKQQAMKIKQQEEILARKLEAEAPKPKSTEELEQEIGIARTTS